MKAQATMMNDPEKLTNICNSEDQDFDCSETACSSEDSLRSSISSYTGNDCELESSIPSLDSRLQCRACNSTSSCDKSTITTPEETAELSSFSRDEVDTTRRVRFFPYVETQFIESRLDMSDKEFRNYWWSACEEDEIKWNAKSCLEQSHQCCKKDCVRGMERKYWTLKIQREGISGLDNEIFRSYVNEFVQPKKQSRKYCNNIKDCDLNSDDKENVDEELRVYQMHYKTYSKVSQQRAHTLALLDEAYVKEHVYGVPCSHNAVEILQTTRWQFVQCCSCYNDERERKIMKQNSSVKNLLKRNWRRVMGGKGRRKRMKPSLQ